VALEVAQRRLVQAMAPVDPVDHLEGAVGLELPAAGLDPPHEGAGFVSEPDPEQRVEREARVADPRVAVVPVPLAADPLREARRRGGDDGPGRVEAEELERQCRPVHHLAPPARVAGPPEPPAPEGRGLPEPGLHLRGREVEPCRVLHRLEDERGPLAVLQGELRDRGVALDAEGDGAGEPQGQRRAAEAHAAGPGLRLVSGPGVVEGRPTLELERDGPADGADHPHDAMRAVLVVAGGDGHEVEDLPDAVRMEEARDQDVGVRQVHLLVSAPPERGGDPEVAPLRVVEDRGEDARRLEARKAAPVDGPGGGYQGYGVEVPDDPVLLDRQIRHGASCVPGRSLVSPGGRRLSYPRERVRDSCRSFAGRALAILEGRPPEVRAEPG